MAVLLPDFGHLWIALYTSDYAATLCHLCTEITGSSSYFQHLGRSLTIDPIQNLRVTAVWIVTLVGVMFALGIVFRRIHQFGLVKPVGQGGFHAIKGIRESVHVTDFITIVSR